MEILGRFYRNEISYIDEISHFHENDKKEFSLQPYWQSMLGRASL
jgi:hypothetical protein